MNIESEKLLHKIIEMGEVEIYLLRNINRPWHFLIMLSGRL